MALMGKVCAALSSLHLTNVALAFLLKKTKINKLKSRIAPETLPMPSSSSKFKYPLAFWRMSISSMLFFAGFNMLLPELPQYFMDIGGEAEQKGYIIALFTLVAMLSRPFSGKLADTVGRVPVMFFGILIAAIAGSLYPIFTFVSGFLVLRFLLFPRWCTIYSQSHTTSSPSDHLHTRFYSKTV